MMMTNLTVPLNMLIVKAFRHLWKSLIKKGYIHGVNVNK